jgi:hypothetical protein
MADPGPGTRNLRLTTAPNTRTDADDQLSTELDAIIVIGRTLSHIPDAETRARVMRWAIARFGIDVTPPEAPGTDVAAPTDIGAAAPQQFTAAESLNVDGLGDMFDGEVDVRQLAAADQALRAREPEEKPKAADRLRDALHWMGI